MKEPLKTVPTVGAKITLTGTYASYSQGGTATTPAATSSTAAATSTPTSTDASATTTTSSPTAPATTIRSSDDHDERWRSGFQGTYEAHDHNAYTDAPAVGELVLSSWGRQRRNTSVFRLLFRPKFARWRGDGSEVPRNSSLVAYRSGEGRRTIPV